MIDRVYLSIDGNHACALLGANLQEGEAEFEPIENWPGHTLTQGRKAAGIAMQRLLNRLNLPEGTHYYVGEGLRYGE